MIAKIRRENPPYDQVSISKVLTFDSIMTIPDKTPTTTHKPRITRFTCITVQM